MIVHHAMIMLVGLPCVFFFPVVLLPDSSSFVAIVRIRSTMLVRLLHGFGLLPSRISGKMTITLDITSIFAC